MSLFSKDAFDKFKWSKDKKSTYEKKQAKKDPEARKKARAEARQRRLAAKKKASDDFNEMAKKRNSEQDAFDKKREKARKAALKNMSNR